MLTAVKLRDQWSALERRLPGDWESVALRIRTEQPSELSEAARVLAPMGVGRAGEELVAHRASGPAATPGRKRPGGSSPGSTSVASGACSSRSGSTWSTKPHPAWRR